MTDDHHDQTAGMATLLLRPMDEILGTHSFGTPQAPPRQIRRRQHLGGLINEYESAA
jgi:hypothetical protein